MQESDEIAGLTVDQKSHVGKSADLPKGVSAIVAAEMWRCEAALEPSYHGKYA